MLSEIYFVNPRNHAVQRRVEVRLSGVVSVWALGELSRFYAAQSIYVVTLLATSFGLFEGV
jgi:hypothetical protein